MRNHIQIIGNLGKDPEVHTFQDGNAVTSISVATSRRYKTRDDEPAEETTWHRVKGFGMTGQIMRDKLARGSKVLIEGRMQYGSYDKDGQTFRTAEVIAQRVLAL